ncbi:uncharacterized protein FIBRA_08650 [Fibroporia radiculosa]|uniref:Uncharacterized protein n=1 Tax=Fibroporia radiculosa TaxID=599839 RepID=J4ICG9_9APHY|nr:uncharacterized protein FIBRA_08650 [Fibroporia radiculosa]CCM06391.1 predicted protein [Fibroporia radiculosa]
MSFFKSILTIFVFVAALAMKSNAACVDSDDTTVDIACP